MVSHAKPWFIPTFVEKCIQNAFVNFEFWSDTITFGNPWCVHHPLRIGYVVSKTVAVPTIGTMCANLANHITIMWASINPSLQCILVRLEVPFVTITNQHFTCNFNSFQMVVEGCSWHHSLVIVLLMIMSIHKILVSFIQVKKCWHSIPIVLPPILHCFIFLPALPPLYLSLLMYYPYHRNISLPIPR